MINKHAVIWQYVKKWSDMVEFSLQKQLCYCGKDLMLVTLTYEDHGEENLLWRADHYLWLRLYASASDFSHTGFATKRITAQGEGLFNKASYMSQTLAPSTTNTFHRRKSPVQRPPADKNQNLHSTSGLSRSVQGLSILLRPFIINICSYVHLVL